MAHDLAGWLAAVAVFFDSVVFGTRIPGSAWEDLPCLSSCHVCSCLGLLAAAAAAFSSIVVHLSSQVH